MQTYTYRSSFAYWLGFTAARNWDSSTSFLRSARAATAAPKSSVCSGWPLFIRELTQLAARRRTYVIRAVAAVVLFSAFFVSYLMATNSGSMGLGQGGALFETVMWIEFAMIYLVLPAAMAGAIAEERERRTLSLLYLSKIQPWGILLQKFASRLVPIMTIVSLGLPLLTISYSLGGVSDDMIWNAIYCLGLGSFQVGAIALWSSVFCHSTVTAVIVTYLLIGLALR